jgi:hypothetical protein
MNLLIAFALFAAVDMTTGSPLPVSRSSAALQAPEASVAMSSAGEAEAQERLEQEAGAEELFLRKRLPKGEMSLPIERYAEARRRMLTMRQHSTRLNAFLPSRAEELDGAPGPANTAGWTPLGPTNMGGRTLTLLIDPGNPALMYAGTADGGVWKSSDTGASWNAVGDMLPRLAVSTLVMDPRNSGILYAGTGWAGTRMNSGRNFDETRGAGVFESVDAGDTWTQLAGSGTPDFQYVSKLALSPATGLLYVATLTGVWRFNAAAGVTQLLAPGAFLAPGTSLGCFDLALRVDAAGNDVLIAACGSSFLGSGVFRNAQAQVDASSWQMVLTNSSMGRTSLAMAPSNPDIVYAVAASYANGPNGDYNQGLLGVWRSTQGGVAGSWELRLLNTSNDILSTLLFSDAYHAAGCHGHRRVYTNLGWYDNVTVVDPQNPDRIWVGGYDLYRSDDGGKTFGAASYWWAQTGHPSYVHRFQHALAFSPGYDAATNQTLFIANDGGVFVTQNSLAATASGSLSVLCHDTNSKVAYSNLNSGFALTEFFGGAVSQDGANYIGGSLSGTLKGSDAGGPSGWSTILGNIGGNVAVDRSAPGTLYVASQVSLDGSNGSLALQKSTDGGVTFQPAAGGITDANFLPIAPFILDPTQPQRLWTGGSYVWLTEDGGQHWSQASGRAAGPATASISSIASSPANSAYVLFGTDEGIIQRNLGAVSGTGHKKWPKARARAGYVSSLTFHPSETSIAYATYVTFGGTHVWKTADGGRSWTGIDGTGAGALPDLPVSSIVVDPVNPNNLYIGTDMGVFVSADDGQNWAVELTGFPNAVVELLVLQVDQAGARTIYAFSHGRGAWRVRLP